MNVAFNVAPNVAFVFPSLKRCEFTDKKLELKLQIVYGCISKRARRKALSEDMDLDALLKFVRAVESSDKQADTIEQRPSSEAIHKISRPGKYSKLYQPRDVMIRKKLCYSCGGIFPHIGGREACPAYGKICRRCNKKNHFAQHCKTRNDEPSKLNKIADSVKGKKIEDNYSDTTSEEEYNFGINPEVRSNSEVNIISQRRLRKCQTDSSGDEYV